MELPDFDEEDPMSFYFAQKAKKAKKEKKKKKKKEDDAPGEHVIHIL